MIETMSVLLARKVLCMECASEPNEKSETKRAAPAPTAPPTLVESEVPMIMRKFARVLKQQELMQHISLGRMILRASLQISSDEVRKELVGYKQNMELAVDADDKRGGVLSTQQWWQQLRQNNCSLPHALSIIMISYNAEEMPVDTQISLRGFQTEFEYKMGERVLCDASLRDCIMLGERTMPPGDKPYALLTRPLVCEEVLTGIEFASVEAIGFNSQYFWKHVARRVPESRVESVGRLFSRAPPSYTDARGSDASNSTAHPSYYYVPHEYAYASLIARVHVYLTLQRLRRESVYELDADSVDPSTYELPSTMACMIFEASALISAVLWIDERLTNVHPIFNPEQLRVAIEPVMAESWTAALRARKSTARTLNAVSLAHGVQQRRVAYTGENKKMSCQASFIIYYAVFKNAAFDPPVHANGVRHDDDDDDGDETDVSEISAAAPSTYVGVTATREQESDRPAESNGHGGSAAAAEPNGYTDWRALVPAAAFRLQDESPRTKSAPPTQARTSPDQDMKRSVSRQTTDSSDDEKGEDAELPPTVPPPQRRPGIGTPAAVSGDDTITDAATLPLMPQRSPPTPPALIAVSTVRVGAPAPAVPPPPQLTTGLPDNMTLRTQDMTLAMDFEVESIGSVTQ